MMLAGEVVQMAHKAATEITHLLDESARAVARAAELEAINADLLVALQQLHDNIAEYARINNLGGFDNQDMQQARAAIARAQGKGS